MLLRQTVPPLTGVGVDPGGPLAARGRLGGGRLPAQRRVAQALLGPRREPPDAEAAGQVACYMAERYVWDKNNVRVAKWVNDKLNRI